MTPLHGAVTVDGRTDADLRGEHQPPGQPHDDLERSCRERHRKCIGRPHTTQRHDSDENSFVHADAIERDRQPRNQDGQRHGRENEQRIELHSECDGDQRVANDHQDVFQQRERRERSDTAPIVAERRISFVQADQQLCRLAVRETPRKQSQRRVQRVAGEGEHQQPDAHQQSGHAEQQKVIVDRVMRQHGAKNDQTRDGGQQRHDEADAAFDENGRERVVDADAKSTHEHDANAVGADRARQCQAPHHGAAVDHQPLRQGNAVAANGQQQSPLVTHQYSIEQKRCDGNQRPQRIAVAQCRQDRFDVRDIHEQ